MKAEPLLTATGEVLEGPLLVQPQLFEDERGFFYESWNQERWSALLAMHGQSSQPFVQDNHSCSAQGVLRGLHWQIAPRPQGKLVRCVVGEIFDVAVDLRLGSRTFGQWVGAPLSSNNHHQLWVPVGFAHGFLTLSSEAEVLYKTTDLWSRECERALRWNDPDVGLQWPQNSSPEPLLSPKDSAAPLLAALTYQDLAF